MAARRALRALGRVMLVGSLMIGPAWAALAQTEMAPPDLPDFAQVRAAWRSSGIVVRDRHGERVAALRRDFHQRRGRWLALAEISPTLQKTVIQSEDRRFHGHSGVDWRALAAASWDTLLQGRARGASTLSMQLVGMLDSALPAPGQRGVLDKLHQAQRALALERRWSKAQILEAYLNLAPFRGELRGVDALSRFLFGKQAHGLDAREAALAAALLRAPNAGTAVLQRRSCAILRQSGQAAACTGLGTFISAVLATARTRAMAADDGAALAPHFARLALASVPQGMDAPAVASDLRTTLDAPLQAQALASVNRHLGPLAAAGVADAAVVVLENASGDVLAYVGSSGAWSQAPFVDHARALRQAGSALKPFLYAQAIDRGYLTAASLLDNRALGLNIAGALYVPHNYDRQTSGWVSLRRALAASLNIPAVRTLTLVGVPAFVQTLRQLGLPLAHDPDFYGYSLALGSADISLLALTNAYRVLANGGCYRPWRALAVTVPSPLKRATTPCRDGVAVFSPQAAWIVGDILADRQARAQTFGLDSALSTPFWSAAKTGTSKDMRDNWTIGWTPHTTVGVWVGNSSGASMRDISGVSGAGPIWHDLVRWLQRGEAADPPPMPSGLVRRPVSFDNGLEPAREEVFLAEAAPAGIHPIHPAVARGGVRIASPVDGLVLALDPDIPPGAQRLSLRSAHADAQAAADVVWVVDDAVVGAGPQQWWSPRRGTHRIALHDGHGRVLDRVVIHLR